jgi:FkbM family methyltransferase
MNQHSLVFRALELYGTRVSHRGQWLVHEKLRGLFGVDVDEDLEVTRGRLRWVLNPSDFMQSALFWLGEQDRWDVFHIKRMLRPGAVVFDVGANFGYYSLVIAASLDAACEVHAFEPNAKTYERLLRNIELNELGGAVRAYKLGLSDSEGTGRMVERVGNSGAASVETGVEDGDTQLTTLDAFCAAHAVSRVDFVKIDIEGFEERMLRGASETLRRHKPPMLVELNPSTLVRENSSAERVAELLSAYGYTLYESRRDKLAPLEKLPQGLDFINAFCLHGSLEDLGL